MNHDSGARTPVSAVAVSQSVRSLFAAAMVAAIVAASAFAFVVATRLQETPAGTQPSGASSALSTNGNAAAVSDESAPAAASTSPDIALLVAALVASVSLVGLLPALVTRAQYFGLAVLGSSVARMLLGMFAALMLTQVGDAAARPVWLGSVAGLGVILVVESILAITVLSYLERLRSAGPVAVGMEPNQAC